MKTFPLREDPRHIARELREVTRDIRLSLGPPQVTARKLITRITTLLRGSAAKLSLSPHEDVREEASRILKRTESIENDYPSGGMILKSLGRIEYYNCSYFLFFRRDQWKLFHQC